VQGRGHTLLMRGVGVAMLAAAACGSDPVEEAAPGSAGNGEDVLVNNFSFTPSQFAVASGEVIAVRNANPSTAHTFTLSGTEIDEELNPVDTVEVPLDLEPGRYDLVCRFHTQMTGTLTVT
jgi:plastocyanin